MPVLPDPTFPPVPGEIPGDRIARILRDYDGCALHDPARPKMPHPRLAELAAFIGRGVCESNFVYVQTNCATVALALLAAAGVTHRLLSTPTTVGRAFSDMVQIGNDFGAWRVGAPSEIPPRGALLWYRIDDGTNDDHVEVMLDAPDEHGGGGRPDNAITIGRGDFHVSWSRPLHKWLDPAALGIPVVEVSTEQGFPAA